MINVNQENLYWLAGLLEGEATFRMSGSSPSGSYPEIALAMSDKDVVYKVASILGGTGEVREDDYGKRKEKSKKVMYVFGVFGDLAIEWMRLLLPLMGERRSNKIREILEIHDKRPVWGEMKGVKSTIAAIARSRNITYEDAKMVLWEVLNVNPNETKQ